MTLSLTSTASNPAPTVRVLADLAYVPGSSIGPRQRLDLYLPEGKRNAPVVISAPGGGLALSPQMCLGRFGATRSTQ